MLCFGGHAKCQEVPFPTFKLYLGFEELHISFVLLLRGPHLLAPRNIPEGLLHIQALINFKFLDNSFFCPWPPLATPLLLVLHSPHFLPLGTVLSFSKHKASKAEKPPNRQIRSR